MSTNQPTSSRPPVRPALAVGAPLIVILMASYQFASIPKHPEHAQLLSVMGWSLVAAAVVLAVSVTIAHLAWVRRRRRDAAAGEASHPES